MTKEEKDAKKAADKAAKEAEKDAKKAAEPGIDLGPGELREGGSTEGESLGGFLPPDGSETPLDPPEAQKSAAEVADEFESMELNKERPLCQPSLRKGVRKLATFRVVRLDDTVEMCSTEEVGAGETYKSLYEL